MNDRFQFNHSNGSSAPYLNGNEKILWKGESVKNGNLRLKEREMNTALSTALDVGILLLCIILAVVFGVSKYGFFVFAGFVAIFFIHAEFYREHKVYYITDTRILTYTPFEAGSYYFTRVRNARVTAMSSSGENIGTVICETDYMKTVETSRRIYQRPDFAAITDVEQPQYVCDLINEKIREKLNAL